jgi:hypothetical protein
MPMLKEFFDLYASDRIFHAKEWHSAYAFDLARTSTGVEGHDLTPGGSGHVWFQCEIGRYTDHLKGARKARGRSAERR